MDPQTLEASLRAALSAHHPGPRDVRDALVDYYAAVATPFIERGLAHTHPDADPALVRRLLVARLSTLWNDLGSPWDSPSIEALSKFRDRVERYACVRGADRWGVVQRLLDELLLLVAVEERLRHVQPRKAVRKLRLIEGGGEVSEPRRCLKLVRADEPERVSV